MATLCHWVVQAIIPLGCPHFVAKLQCIKKALCFVNLKCKLNVFLCQSFYLPFPCSSVLASLIHEFQVVVDGLWG